MVDPCVRDARGPVLHSARRMHSQHHGGGKPTAVSHAHRQRDSKQRGSRQHVDSKHHRADRKHKMIKRKLAQSWAKETA